MTTQHELKTIPAYFQATWTGRKPFDVRYDDRGYQRGDTVLLREWDRDWPCECNGRHTTDCARYTGRTIKAEIGHVTASTPASGGQRGFFGQGHVVLGLCQIVTRSPSTPPTEATAQPPRPTPAVLAGGRR